MRNLTKAHSNFWICQDDGLLKDSFGTIFSKTALKCVKMLHGLWRATKTTSTKSTISTTSLHISSSLPSFTTNLYPEIFTEYVESATEFYSESTTLSGNISTGSPRTSTSSPTTSNILTLRSSTQTKSSKPSPSRGKEKLGDQN